MTDTAILMYSRVLLVEDDKPLRDILALKLAEIGYLVTPAEDGGQALEYLHNADLVLLNLKLPKVSGLELLKFMREQGNLTPVVVISGSEDLFGEVDKYDVVEIIPKPLNINYVLDRVKANLKLNKSLETLERKAVTFNHQMDGVLASLKNQGIIEGDVL